MTHTKALAHNTCGANPTDCPGALDVVDIFEDGLDYVVVYKCLTCGARVPIHYAWIRNEDGSIGYRWQGETKNSYFVPDRMLKEQAAAFVLDFSEGGNGDAGETD